MPIITAFPDNTNAQVRVEVNWADTPAVLYAKVLRYNPATGECVPLRPYVCYDGDYLALSCGHGIFFDTEMPLDTEFYYITEGIDAPCLPGDPIFLDTFSRNLVDNWGSPNIGGPYLNVGGAASDYDVNGSQGTQLLNSVNVLRHSTSDVGSADSDFYGEVTAPIVATGAPISTRLVSRYTDANNNYIAQLSFGLAGVASLDIRGIAAGVGMLITATVPVGTYTTGDRWAIHFRTAGSSLAASAWNLTQGQLEPTVFTAQATDVTLVSGDRIGVASRLDTGNLNSPQTIAWDNLRADLPCAPCVPVSVDTSLDPTTIPSNGIFRLRDPVRPCNDQPVPLCFTQANSVMDDDGFCIPGSGIFFASMDVENYEPNQILVNPTNAKYPISVNRTRRGVASLLTLVTRTFADRDAILALNAPGSPLFWHGPAAYGIDDQYMAVSTVSVARGLSDHKYQVRVLQLPYTSVARPAGPQQGVCGSQVGDLCDFTWDQLAAAGNTFEDLIRGRPTGGTTGYRTWTIGTRTVLADFANWNAVNTAGRDWIGVEVGT